MILWGLRWEGLSYKGHQIATPYKLTTFIDLWNRTSQHAIHREGLLVVEHSNASGITPYQESRYTVPIQLETGWASLYRAVIS
jgi:hypothetical protein